MENDISLEMETLMYNFWVIKEENPELYHIIKKNQNKIKNFLGKNVGSNLIIHDKFIKLEKVPTVPNENTGIPSFTNILDYCILLILLIFLEDKTKGDKFILSDLIEYIKNTAVTLELDNVPDWNLISNRRSLVNVLDFLNEINVLKLKGSEKLNFIDSKDADALYEVTGISNYVMRIFDNQIFNTTDPQDFLKNEFLNQNEERGDIRRYKIFRNILFTPGVTVRDLTTSEIDYIKKNRNYIKGEIEDNVDMEVEITKNTIIAFDKETSKEKDNFPNNKKISEIVLMANKIILDDIKSGKIKIDDCEIAKVDKSYMKNVTREIKAKKTPYLSKYFEELSSDKFYSEITNYMKDYNFIRECDDYFLIYPMVGKMVGITKEVVNEEKYSKINLFGGKEDELQNI